MYIVKKLGIILPLISGIMWGASGLFVRTMTEQGMDSVTIVFSKYAYASILLFLGILIIDRSLFRIRPKDLWIFLASGLSGMIFLNVCYNCTMTTLSLSLAAVLLCLAPVFTVVLSAVIFKERITAKKIICMCFAILGCALLSGVFEDASGAMGNVVGILIGLLSALFYAINNIVCKVAVQRGYHSLTVTFYSILLCPFILAPFSNFENFTEFNMGSFPITQLFFLMSALITAVLPYVLFTASLPYVDAGIASILASGGEPSAAMILGIMVYAEVPSLPAVTGLAITIAALSILTIPRMANTADS